MESAFSSAFNFAHYIFVILLFGMSGVPASNCRITCNCIWNISFISVCVACGFSVWRAAHDQTCPVECV